MRLTFEMSEKKKPDKTRKKRGKYAASYRIVNGTCNKRHKLGNLMLSLLNLWRQIHCVCVCN